MPNDDVVTLPGISGIRMPSTKGDPTKTREWWEDYSDAVLRDLSLAAISYAYGIEDFLYKVESVWMDIKEDELTN
jgi:hypothetical protein